jgi:large subunit ribosomal protein L19
MAKTPDIKPGDLVKVYSKIKEGDKDRTTTFQGIVMQVRGMAKSKTFTVRKISAGVGVERIFPFSSPMIKTEIKKKGSVRRAKLSYLRQRKGRKMKITEAVLKVKEPESEELDTSMDDKPAEPVAEKSKKPVAEKPAPEKITEQSEKKETKKTKEPKDEPAPGQKSVDKT